MKLDIWVHDSGFGLAYTATQSNHNLDMTKHNYVFLQEVEVEATEEEAYKIVEGIAESIKEAKRAKLIAELEALDNE